MSSAYSLLGVSRTASSEEIRNAYKEKAMLNHPDRGGDPVIWGELQKAYDILSDPQRRQAYDKSRVVEGSAEKQYAEGFAASEQTRKGMSISKQVRPEAPTFFFPRVASARAGSALSCN